MSAEQPHPTDEGDASFSCAPTGRSAADPAHERRIQERAGRSHRSVSPLVFILENTKSVAISYFGAHGHMALGIALLLAAVVGALLVARARRCAGRAATPQRQTREAPSSLVLRRLSDAPPPGRMRRRASERQPRQSHASEFVIALLAA